MGGQVWFGTRELMQWVAAPLANYSGSNVGWRVQDLYLSGGAGVRNSQTTHKELDLSWGVQSAEKLASVVATLQRRGPYFFCDPLAMKVNIVPPYWATPTDDAPTLIPGINYTMVNGSTNNQGYSIVAARYVVPSGGKATSLEIPVPPGYNLYLGVHGTGTGNWTFKGKGTTGSGAMMTPTSTARTNMTYTGPGFATLVAPAGTQTIQGIIAQVVPTSAPRNTGPFVPGMGFTGLELKDDPSTTTYSSEIPNAQIGVAASFVEVGAWL